MKRDELPALTGARFYAAFLVYLNHIIFLPGCESLRGMPVFELGGLGVTFFFVLSGFILSYNYEPTFRSGVTGMAYRSFLWARFSKIYPTYLATLLISIPVSMGSPTLPLDWAAVPIQVSLLQCWVPFALPPFYAYLNTVGWSISCEAFFYLLAPLLITRYARASRGWPEWILTGTLLLGAYSLVARLVPPHSPALELYFKERFAGMRVVDFAVGVCLGVAMLRNRTGLERRAVPLQAAGLLALAAAVVFRTRFPAWSHDSRVLMPGVVLLILGLASGRGALVRHLSHPWVRLMGLSSFAFYMLHHLVLRYMKALMRAASVEPPPVEAAAWVAVAFLTTCFLSLVAYARFEMPVQQAMRHWLAGRSPDPSG